ncbi:MAG: type II toxin-antitoxin system RelE/ParE family toxin [Fulvimarina manganoxydans]|uniref:type II toxin-antitoxin system RelE/ParE family toxin n=1 Tax=Fulvimarina manganoxydans TaxID=937218 RepID=UPI0023542BAC|nr:type II toxin-antitoxin system RelE/ParE family toxin [Fulvimarina manganoxydans]MCK5933742.1 type II toxin-antitoxin system RelE/ParE family toxin [Fulvimarina manganoxydans]
MKLRFTQVALRQIDTTLAYLQDRSRSGSLAVGRRIRDVTVMLAQHPDAGQMTDKPGVRRAVLTPYPFVIYYRVTESEVVIMRFRHAAREG